MTFKIPLNEATFVWQHISLGAIGGILDSLLNAHNDQLNGVSVGIRKTFILISFSFLFVFIWISILIIDFILIHFIFIFIFILFDLIFFFSFFFQ